MPGLHGGTTVIAQKNKIQRNLFLGQILMDTRRRFTRIDRDNGKGFIGEALTQTLHSGHFIATRLTPGRPEIH